MNRLIQSLSPRRQELYFLILDHAYMSFDAIARRFPGIPKRSLSYDLYMLCKQGVVVKHGVTRGASYSVMVREKDLEMEKATDLE
jgi:predicted transcriptional regulator